MSRAKENLWKNVNAFSTPYSILPGKIIYYDNGQIELTKILTSVFNTLYAHVEFRKVKPVDYKLFQAADLICTMELLAEKADSNLFSNSEKEFFYSVRDFKKNYFKPILKKHL